MYKILWAFYILNFIYIKAHQKYLEDINQGSKLVAGQGHMNEVQTPQSASLQPERAQRVSESVSMGIRACTMGAQGRDGEEGWSKQWRTKCKEAERTQWILDNNTRY